MSVLSISCCSGKPHGKPATFALLRLRFNTSPPKRVRPPTGPLTQRASFISILDRVPPPHAFEQILPCLITVDRFNLKPLGAEFSGSRLNYSSRVNYKWPFCGEGGYGPQSGQDGAPSGLWLQTYRGEQ